MEPVTGSVAERGCIDQSTTAERDASISTSLRFIAPWDVEFSSDGKIIE